MTTLSIVAGLIPVAIGIGAGSEQRASIAVTIIGGQTLCLLLTLLVVPVAYSYLAELEALPWSTLAGKIFRSLARFGAQSWFGLIARLGTRCFHCKNEIQRGNDFAWIAAPFRIHTQLSPVEETLRTVKLRTIILLAVLTMVVIPAFAQKQKPKKSGESGAEKKQENSQQAPATPAPAKDDEEDKGPWKALNYRLIGPFRGGRVLAVSGVVGQDNTYYFGGVAGVFGRPPMAAQLEASF